VNRHASLRIFRLPAPATKKYRKALRKLGAFSFARPLENALCPFLVQKARLHIFRTASRWSVDDYQGLSLPVRKVFEVKDGGKYRLVRWLDETTFFYTTVFAFTSEQADTLTPIALTTTRVAMIVRVVHREPEARKWPGFFFYGSEKPFEFGFICEEIVPQLPEIRGSDGTILTFTTPKLRNSDGGSQKTPTDTRSAARHKW